MSAVPLSTSLRFALGCCMPQPCASKAQPKKPPLALQKLSSAGYIQNFCTLWTAMTMWTTVDTSGHLLLSRLLWSGTWHKQFICPPLVTSLICHWVLDFIARSDCVSGRGLLSVYLHRFSTSSSNPHSSQLWPFTRKRTLRFSVERVKSNG